MTLAAPQSIYGPAYLVSSAGGPTYTVTNSERGFSIESGGALQRAGGFSSGSASASQSATYAAQQAAAEKAAAQRSAAQAAAAQRSSFASQSAQYGSSSYATNAGVLKTGALQNAYIIRQTQDQADDGSAFNYG